MSYFERMMMTSTRRFQKTFIVTAMLFAICLGGCYSYRGGTIPHVAPSVIAVPRMQRVITYDLRLYSNVGGDAELDRLARRELESAIRLAGARLELSGRVADPDAHLVAEVKSIGNPGAQFLSGFLSGFTFAVVPAYASIEYVMEVELHSGAKFPKRYRYADSTSLWIQIFLLPFTNSSDRVAEDLIADMMRSLAHDMQRDGFLPTPPEAERSTEDQVTVVESGVGVRRVHAFNGHLSRVHGRGGTDLVRLSHLHC
jgi:hypothetical protein